MSYHETGLVRNVDDLGRIALPKLIRDILKVERWKDTIEFFIDRLTGCVVIKKVESQNNLTLFILDVKHLKFSFDFFHTL